MANAKSYGAIFLAAFSFAAIAISPVTAQDLNLLRRPQNSAISVPLGQGLDMIHSAEPLGKGRFRVRALNRSVGLTIPELGQGSIYTGNYGYAFGFSPAIDISFLVPFLLDSAGGLNKYGTGDPVVGIKYARQTKVPSSSHSAFQLLFTLPLGYKGEHALDKVGGIRPFSSESVDLGLQYLVDLHFRRLSLYINGGFFRSGNLEVLSQLVYGLGIEVGRQNRWASFNAEYQARVSFTQESRASGALKFGTRIRLFRGIQLELNREIGFLDHPTKGAFTFGVRMHGFRRKLGTRHTLYIPPAPIKRTSRLAVKIAGPASTRSTRLAFRLPKESRASGALKFGTRIRLFRGIQLELNREIGFLDHPTKGAFYLRGAHARFSSASWGRGIHYIFRQLR